MAAIAAFTKFCYWFVVPIALLASVIFRFNVLSAIYLLFFLGFPYSPKLSPSTISSWQACTLAMSIVSGMFLIGHIVFQVVLLAHQPYGSLLGNDCSTTERIFRYIGLQRLNTADAGNIVRLILPDVVVFIVSILTFVLIKKTIRHFQQTSQQQSTSQEAKQSRTAAKLLNASIMCFTVLFMALAAIAYPSVTSSVYLLSFLIFVLVWSFNQPIVVKWVAVFRACLSILTGVHLVALYVYQVQFMQIYIISSALYARLLGFTPIIKTSCSATYQLLLYPGLKWTVFVSPACLFVLHWLLAIGVRMYFDNTQILTGSPQTENGSQGRRTKKANDEKKKTKEIVDDETSQPLVESEEVPRNYEATVSNVPDDITTVQPGQNEDVVDGKSENGEKGFLQQTSKLLSDVRSYSFYVVALIIMMVWSVTYHSWLTLVLLLLSCILWMTTKRSLYTLRCSPFFTIYGILLILLQFIYSLDLNESELPTIINKTQNVIYLSEFGLNRYIYPCLPLGAKILYLCGFFLVLHQFIYIRKSGGQRNQQVDENAESTTTDEVVAWIKEQFCRYWIFVVVGFHIAISTEGYPTGIKTIYLAFFLLNVSTYTFSWLVWRKTLTLYWTMLVAYTMIVLMVIYTYQFQSFPDYWMSLTKFNQSQMEDLGLVQYKNAGELLLRILLPTLFLLSIILQLHYFNKRFLEVTDTPMVISSPGGSQHSGDGSNGAEHFEMDELNREKVKKHWFKAKMTQLWNFLVKAASELSSFILRALEFHVWRLVFITVFVAAAYKVSVISAILVIFWVIFLPVRPTHTTLYVVTTLYVALILLGNMFYQLQFISENTNLYYNCHFNSRGSALNTTYYLLDWIGFVKMPKTAAFFYHIEGYLAIIIMIALERTVVRRQDWRRKWRNERPPPVTAFYPSINHKNVDKGLLECCQFFLNYFFYKFGVECCFTMVVIVVWVRMDIYASLYSILLIILMSVRTRLVLARYWRFYIILLMTILVGQYLICLGMPPVWCATNTYPWNTLGNSSWGSRLIRWLYLPDYVVIPNAHSLVADFFLLLFFTSQMFVFNREKGIGLNYGGDNRYLRGADLDKITRSSNPKKTFMNRTSRTVLDQLKTFVFKYMIWVTMAIIFVAGTSRISLFCLGYLISFFYLLQRQTHLMMGKPSRLLKIWNIIIGYNLAVITLKASLQIASCVFIDTLQSRACAFVQILSLVCSYPEAYQLTVTPVSIPQTCELSYVNAGLSWDFVCFLFLLLQKRIFSSHYFIHVVDDMRAAMELASRGGELFNRKLIEEVREREEVEEKSISIIRDSMMVIKERYASLQQGMKGLDTHIGAIMSGDYYMFDDDEKQPDLSATPDEIMDPVKMMHKAGTVGIDETLKERELDKEKIGETTEIKEKKDALGADVVDADEDKEEDEDGMKEQEEVGGDQDEEESEEEHKKSIFGKVKTGLTFVWELCLSAVDYLTLKLNEWNKDYRNIVLQLSAEKDEQSAKLCSLEPRASVSDVAIVVEDGESQSKENSTTPRSVGTDEEFVELKAIEFDKDQHRLLRLFYAIWYSVISRTDLVCYFLIILNLMLESSMISLILPLAVFLWACFCIPRPTKEFWTFVLIYLQIVIVLKFIFQFEFFPWNSLATTNLNKDNPFFAPRFIGIDQSASWMVMDLLQLLAVFFHISVIKVYGLWNKTEKNCGDDEKDGDKQNEEECSTSSGTIPADQRQSSQTSKNINASNSVASGAAEQEGHASVIEQGHASVDEGDALVKAEDENKDKKSVAEKVCDILKSPYDLYSAVLNQRFTAVTDVYIYMFLCDVINFVIIIFGYWAFGAYSTQQANVVSNLQSNQVPTGFLIMLLIQFSMMIIDRGLYLRKNMLGKLIFQIILIIGVHVWLFFILPAINQRPFYQNQVAQTWYFFKALYFLLSAYQLRAGYPNRVCGNFLTKSYGTLNLFLFKGYRAIPFLAELTAIMNWMYSETSMAVGEWMKLWSIHAEVFELKCWRVFNTEYPSPRGVAKKDWIKYLIGGSLVFILLFIIWFPLLLMNVVMTIAGVTNNPIQVDVSINLGTFEPLFQVSADASQITTMTTNEFSTFSKQFASIPAAASFLTGFSASQVVKVRIDGQSKTNWIISPPQRQLMMARLHQNNTNVVQITFYWTLIKDPSKTSVPSATGFNTLLLSPGSKARNDLYQLLSSNQNATLATLKNLYPRYIYSTATSSKAGAATSLYLTTPPNLSFTNVSLALRSDVIDNMTSWWSVFEENQVVPQLPMVILSDKVSPSSISFLVNYGIIGLYVSVVLVVGRVVRGIFVGATSTIMFLDLPDVDRILQLCNDIFLVREEQEYELEEDLFAKLIFLYRCPELLIKWTRPKRE